MKKKYTSIFGAFNQFYTKYQPNRKCTKLKMKTITFKAQMERIYKNYWRIGPFSPQKNRH